MWLKVGIDKTMFSKLLNINTYQTFDDYFLKLINTEHLYTMLSFTTIQTTLI